MSLTDDMKSLRENIDAAQADRTKWISDNRKDTKEMLNGFRKEHKEMAGVLRRDLETYVTNIKKETKTLLGDARSLMNGYRAELDGMHNAWIGKGEAKRKRHKKTEAE